MPAIPVSSHCLARNQRNPTSSTGSYAQVQNEHVWSAAWIDIMTGGMTPQAAAEKAFKRVEEIFGWAKTVGGFRKTRMKGRMKTWASGYWVLAAYNLTRMVRLLRPTPA